MRILTEKRISADEVMMSFDLKSLYTNLLVKRALSVVCAQLENDHQLQSRTPLTAGELSTLLEFCLTPTYLTFQGLFYRLSDGVAMGSPVSSVVANIYMEHLERKLMNAQREQRAHIWKRYVDDVFSILKRTSVQAFLAYINSSSGLNLMTRSALLWRWNKMGGYLFSMCWSNANRKC